jgi:peptidoglycan/xylan/chitin deacetylase (PgdA/CDA1 family)
MIILKREPITWPNGALIALVPGVAFETWPQDLGMPGSLNWSFGRPYPPKAVSKKDIGVISDRQFGERVGIYRLIELFEKEDVKTTFFLNGANVERFPDLSKEILKAGHELASESYEHDYNYMKTYDTEKNDIVRTVTAFKKIVGVNPSGYLSTGVKPTENTADIISGAGYLYWVDLLHEELPYTLVVNNRELVVLSYSQYLNDYSTYTQHDRSPRELLQIWKDTFDYLYSEAERYPNMMLWGLHPFLSGRPYRAKVLEEFLEYARKFPKVWFARCIDIAKWWMSKYKDQHVEKWPNCLKFSDWPSVSKAGFADPEYASSMK